MPDDEYGEGGTWMEERPYQRDEDADERRARIAKQVNDWHRAKREGRKWAAREWQVIAARYQDWHVGRRWVSWP